MPRSIFLWTSACLCCHNCTSWSTFSLCQWSEPIFCHVVHLLTADWLSQIEEQWPTVTTAMPHFSLFSFSNSLLYFRSWAGILMLSLLPFLLLVCYFAPLSVCGCIHPFISRHHSRCGPDAIAPAGQQVYTLVRSKKFRWTAKAVTNDECPGIPKHAFPQKYRRIPLQQRKKVKAWIVTLC